MTTGSTARYDGLADWYDARFVAGAEPHQPGLLDLLGPGSGPCLDIGCGTGRNFETIRASGRSVVGVDYSADQLRLARTRTDGPLMVADAAVLPFADASFDTAMVMWISTDVDDFGKVLREATRVLRPGGVLVTYGVHPCFNGPHVVWNEDGSRLDPPELPPTRLARGVAVVGRRRHPPPRRHAPRPPRRVPQRLPHHRPHPRTLRRTGRHRRPPLPGRPRQARRPQLSNVSSRPLSTTGVGQAALRVGSWMGSVRTAR